MKKKIVIFKFKFNQSINNQKFSSNNKLKRNKKIKIINKEKDQIKISL